MELYNLITLLKPGQLKTASEFRKEFMTPGDLTDPRNRGRLKELLGQVMIYNLCAAGSVEEYILDVLDRKINMFENPVTKSMDPLVRAGCGASSHPVHFCKNLHMLCPECNRGCPVC